VQAVKSASKVKPKKWEEPITTRSDVVAGESASDAGVDIIEDKDREKEIKRSDEEADLDSDEDL
jgi:hypothetical protein